MMDQPKISIKESSQKEKQIVVNAHTLKESSINQGSYDTASLQPSRPKFPSLSLPNSANSSPLFPSTLMKRKSKSGVVESPCQASSSNMTLNHHYLLQEEIHLRKSKSCGEGRASACAPFDEFDLWLTKPSVVVEHDHMHHHHHSFSKTEAIIKESHVSSKELETNADEGFFKCSALCMYLPGFGKAKPIKTKKEGSEIDGVVSRTVSLDKFECGSWTSSTLFHEIERDSTNSYFDLPMELIKCSGTNDDVHAPVTSAFVFEKDLKGVLKSGSSNRAASAARKSDASPHHVRFSISSSTPHPSSPALCNTPCLRKAREDFNAFLEAQSA